jgi:hypothetical protein
MFLNYFIIDLISVLLFFALYSRKADYRLITLSPHFIIILHCINSLHYFSVILFIITWVYCVYFFFFERKGLLCIYMSERANDSG